MVTTTMGMKRTLAASRRNIHQANTSHVAKPVLVSFGERRGNSTDERGTSNVVA